ncbi:MAG: hypothetical protein AVDCRST_MAG95-494 [uncultured Adhaeribacter sp.]|uniref:Uncharacterized protein n=1 Tax=uncultured Adhaeribacter sp. TaxID=448109 RepID=A0A6J4HEN1_9BACT|nr:MAG: hypothetical protein AVDCRST_MAG95-494 [uncultured Adhaeribacter sp.]
MNSPGPLDNIEAMREVLSPQSEEVFSGERRLKNVETRRSSHRRGLRQSLSTFKQNTTADIDARAAESFRIMDSNMQFMNKRMQRFDKTMHDIKSMLYSI